MMIAQDLSKSAWRVRLCICSVLSMLRVRPSTGSRAGIHPVYKDVEGFGLPSRMLEVSLSAAYMMTAASHFQKLESFVCSLGI
jgi:hypothetical protein